jgi:hypothetical protein
LGQGGSARSLLAADTTVSSHGVRLRLRATDSRTLEAFLARLPANWKTSGAGRTFRTYSLATASGRRGRAAEHIVYQDDAELFSHRDLETLLSWFEAAVRLYVAEMSPGRTFVHAGAVAWAGRAIILPGRPDIGKSTLTAALVRAGAKYLSDEFALVADDARIHPFPKPFWFVRPHVGGLLTIPVEEFGGVQETRSFPAGLIVLTSYGARRWRPRPVTPGKAILELLAHTLSAQQNPRATLRRLEQVVTTVPVLKGGRGEAEVTAPLILRRLEAVIGG